MNNRKETDQLRHNIKGSMLILAVIMLSFGCSESPTDDGDGNGGGTDLAPQI